MNIYYIYILQTEFVLKHESRRLIQTHNWSSAENEQSPSSLKLRGAKTVRARGRVESWDMAPFGHALTYELTSSLHETGRGRVSQLFIKRRQDHEAPPLPKGGLNVAGGYGDHLLQWCACS